MVKAFTVVSWNVRHFKGDPGRIDRVISYLKKQSPDLFAIYEVTGNEVYRQLGEAFPNFTFQITEGSQTQEILVGVRNTLTCFLTQKVEFKSGTTHMRPGLLATITLDEAKYVLLFLHLASSTEPRGMGLRDDMLDRAIKFRKRLDNEAGGRFKSNYIFLGDLNTMGMEYPYGEDITATRELRKSDSQAQRYYGMRRLKKTFEKTWNAGSDSSLDPANLDHIFAAKHLEFTTFKNENNEDVEVDVRGWVNESTISNQDRWINDYSDHSLLYFEVQKVSQ